MSPFLYPMPIYGEASNHRRWSLGCGMWFSSPLFPPGPTQTRKPTLQLRRQMQTSTFEERLATQRKEREMATKELGFKQALSKEEKIEKKKQRLAAIGEDLLSIPADQPFRFPATFTFVVRAFSVLDGIEKGLDPRFDITEIAKPYALELLKFRETKQYWVLIISTETKQQ